jgi:RHS repeat-associated protein
MTMERSDARDRRARAEGARGEGCLPPETSPWLESGLVRGFIVVVVALVALLALTSLAVGTQPYETYEGRVAADGPVSQFRFDDAAGATTVKDSVGAYTATNTGITLGGEGPFSGSKSGSFGGEAYATLPADPLEGASEFTAEAWVDWAGGTSYKQPVFGFGSSSTNYMYLTPASTLTGHKSLFEIHTSSATAQVSAAKLAAKTWEYVAVTETAGGTLTLYLNGEQAGQATGATVSPASLGSSPSDYLGRSLVTGAPDLKGSLSNVAFYTKALSASQIEAHYDDAEYPVNTSAPTVTGTTRDGSTVTAKAGSWSGLTPITFAYQWTLCNGAGEACTKISSATEAKYTATHEDVGSTLRVAVTASNAAGAGTATSPATPKVEPLAPANTTLPAISGEAKDGQLLAVSNGTWGGTPPLSYSYQWEMCGSGGGSCKKITGATASGYRVITGEIGKTLRAIVTAENAGGTSNATTEATSVIVAGPPVNTALPAMAGTPEEGKTLTASIGSWAGTATITYTYQWQHCNSTGESCTNIAGATSEKYTVSSSDLGNAIRFTVTATNAEGTTSASAEATVPVTAIPPTNTAPPSITGEPKDGQQLTASSGSWTGPQPISYSYQWQRCNSTGESCSSVPSAAEPTYAATAEDVGSTLRVDVTATHLGASASSTSAATAVVTAVAPSNTSLPTISGEAKAEQTLTASPGEWAGSPPVTYIYQWERCLFLFSPTEPFCEVVSEGATFTLRDEDVEWEIRVTVTAHDPVGETRTSSHLTTAVLPPRAPRSTSPPEIAGTPQEGQVLETNGGEWEGVGRISETYQWEHCNVNGSECANIEGATSFSYVPGIADLGTTIRVTATATNATGATSATSQATAVVIQAQAPVSTEAATIKGVPRPGQTLTAGTGSWETPFPIAYTYQWQRCSGPDGERCINIPEAAGATYTLGASDPADSTLRVIVTATNVYDVSASSTSTPRLIPASARVSEYTYDANGNLASSTDSEGRATIYTYGPENEQTKVTNPNGTATETAYDADGRIVSQTDANKQSTKYARNVLGQVTEVTDPLGRKTKMEYDPAGNLASLTDAAGRTTYTYDSANRLTETSYSDGKTPAVKYEYDADGNRVKMTDGTGTNTDTYDELDRLSSATDGHGATTSYEYNLDDEPTKITYPNGKAVERSYDNDDRLASVTDWLGNTTSFTYDPDSNLTSTIFPEATHETDEYRYDSAGEPTDTSFDNASGTLASLQYERNSEGQVDLATSSGLAGEETTQYAYDQDSRLTKAGSTAYEYDADGNPTKDGASTNAYDAADQLETSSTASYAYNEVGERNTTTTPTAGPATTYGYDQAGDLTSVTRPKESEIPAIEDSYGYNGEGLRTSETVSGSTAYLTWDLAEPLPLLLSDGADSFIYGPGGIPVEQINNTTGTATYLHHDQAGSTRLLTGSTGKTEGSYSYSPYGTPEHTGTATTPLGYDGEYTSSDTGLIYLRAREYDPATGQFLTRDPLAAISGAPYSYAGDNPLNRSDPTGLLPFGIKLPSWEEAGEAVAGWGDTITFGLTKKIREGIGDENVDTCSGAYQSGGVAGLVTGALIPGEDDAEAGELGVEGVDEGADVGSTPEGRPFTQHYGLETGPERNIPGSVVDQTINENPGVPGRNGTTVYYDPNNDVTVVTGRNGSIVSARRGEP